MPLKSAKTVYPDTACNVYRIAPAPNRPNLTGLYRLADIVKLFTKHSDPPVIVKCVHRTGSPN